MQLAGQVIEGLLWFFIAFMWVRFVTEWVQVFARSWSPRGVLLVGLEVVYSVTDPPIKALRRVIPPLRIGNFALDLSMLLVFIGAYVLLRINRAIFFEPLGHRPDRRGSAGGGAPASGAMVSTDINNSS